MIVRDLTGLQRCSQFQKVALLPLKASVSVREGRQRSRAGVGFPIYGIRMLIGKESAQFEMKHRPVFSSQPAAMECGDKEGERLPW